MRRLALVALPLAMMAGWLSTLKEEELRLQKESAITEAKKLHDSWLSPIKMSYLYQKGDQFPNQELKSFRISLDQPIFKSGGIWAAIKYANAKRIASLYGVKLNRKNLVALVIELAYKLRQADLRIQKQRLLIQNAHIDVKIKKDAYLAGMLDSTFLDQALLQKNAKELALLDLREQKAQLKKNLKDLSDEIPKKLPRFALVPRGEYLAKNLTLKEHRAQIKAAKYYRWMSIARYLPSLSLMAEYDYQRMRGSLYFPAYSYQDHYHTYGFRLFMPLWDFNAPKEIQKAKITYLQAANQLAQAKRERQSLYAKTLKTLRLLDKKIALAKEDQRIYTNLLRQTKELYKAGEKTSYDVQTLQNSLQARRLDQKIYDLQRQIELLRLYKEIDAF